MKRTLIIVFIAFVTVPCAAQWRDIGFGNPDGKDFLSGPPLTICAHDSCIFLSLVPYDKEYPLIDRYTASTGWIAADTGLDRTQGNVTAIASLGPYLFASQGNRRLVVSSNNGLIWTPGNATGPVAANGTYLFGGLGTSLARSGDTDSSWQRTTAPAANYFATFGVSILASTNSGIYRSVDNGTNWATIPAPPTGMSLAAFAAIGTQLFAGGSGIFRSTDSGLSWTHISHPSDTVNVLASYQHYLLAGTDTGIFISSDSGHGWRSVNENMGAQPGYHPNVKLFAILDTLLFTYVDAGLNHQNNTEYGYVTARPISEMTPKSTVAVVPTPVDSIEVYPNPTTNLVSILSGAANILSVNVMNVLGENMLNLPFRNESSISFDLSKLPSGTYFLEIETAKGVVLRKIVRE